MFGRNKDRPAEQTSDWTDHLAPSPAVPDIAVSGVVEAIGQVLTIEMSRERPLVSAVYDLDDALKTRFVIKLEGDPRIHRLMATRSTEKLALTSRGHTIAFVVSAAEHRVINFENLTLWPEGEDAGTLSEASTQ